MQAVGNNLADGLYSYFPLGDKNDVLEFATTVQEGAVSYSTGLIDNSLFILADANGSRIFMGASSDDHNGTYLNFMYDDASLNV